MRFGAGLCQADFKAKLFSSGGLKKMTERLGEFFPLTILNQGQHSGKIFRSVEYFKPLNAFGVNVIDFPGHQRNEAVHKKNSRNLLRVRP